MRYLFLVLLLLPRPAAAQQPVETILAAEAAAGRFSGAALVVQQGRVVARAAHGLADRPGAVPITDSTRFPIASLTKTLTALLVLQFQEQGRLQLTDKASAYLPDLPPDCRNITLRELLTHYAGLQNEPGRAYAARLSTAEFVRTYVRRKAAAKAPGFHYNNVDYILLTRVLEVVGGRPYAELLREGLLAPLGLRNTGVLTGRGAVPNLAYGYHNYSFGEGTGQEPLLADTRELTNYAGAGAVYSTVADLARLVQALHGHRLLRPRTMRRLVIRPQQPDFIDYARGRPTIGFYFNDHTFSRPVLERRGSIEGFNSLLLTTPDFTTAVILLCNTDTGDLEKIGDAVFNALR
ncbi:beta-lactamase family protein [Hymenobacter sp. NST-14]|uniref:serine hydrolase domain-containing protein n=1 Tax=Hymenobacter piscis TaxID=2839984 RepID=UPI001C01CCE6|nr:serine hydrolase domain-containing protein [Hymenobacter piscis]MBT9394188.1 beta-lactamase family protein [Hymenobacter piscis]